MTDQTENTPFKPLPFQLNQPQPQENTEDAPRKRGPRRGWKKDKAKVEAKPRATNGPKPKTNGGVERCYPIDALLAMQAVVGLTSDDTKLVVGVVQALQAFDRESQQRVVTALGRIFNGS